MRTNSAGPSLDDIERDLSALDGLPPAERLTLVERVEVLAARLRTRVLFVAANTAPAPASAGERAIRVREAARLLGTSADSLYRRWRGLPELRGYIDDADSRLKFPLSALEAWIRAGR